MTRIYWGIVTPDEVDGLPEVLFATEELLRFSIAQLRQNSPLMAMFVKVVRVQVDFDNIERADAV